MASEQDLLHHLNFSFLMEFKLSRFDRVSLIYIRQTVHHFWYNDKI